MMTPTPPASPLPWTMRCHGPIGGSVAGPTSQQCRKRGRWLRGYAEPLCGEHAQRAGYAGCRPLTCRADLRAALTAAGEGA